MTKYECCYAEHKPCRCVIECSDGVAPFRCCLTGDRSCNWRKVEDQKPEWCKIGAWVWHSPFDGIVFEQPYFKIERIDGELVYEKYHNNGFPVHYTYLTPARLRPWNDDELKSKVGKVFEMGNGDLTVCLGFSQDRGTLYFAGKGPCSYSAESLAESDWKLDGSRCGVLEHKNEQGEWVE